MVGAKFSNAGMTVQVTYNDGTKATITNYTYPTTALALGTKSVAISYTKNGATATVNQAITVHAQKAQYEKWTAESKWVLKSQKYIGQEYVKRCISLSNVYSAGPSLNSSTGLLTLSSPGSDYVYGQYNKKIRHYCLIYDNAGTSPGNKVIRYDSPVNSSGEPYSKIEYWTEQEPIKKEKKGTVTLTNDSVTNNAIASDGFLYIKISTENINGGWDPVS